MCHQLLLRTPITENTLMAGSFLGGLGPNNLMFRMSIITLDNLSWGVSEIYILLRQQTVIRLSYIFRMTGL